MFSESAAQASTVRHYPDETIDLLNAIRHCPVEFAQAVEGLQIQSAMLGIPRPAGPGTPFLKSYTIQMAPLPGHTGVEKGVTLTISAKARVTVPDSEPLLWTCKLEAVE